MGGSVVRSLSARGRRVLAIARSADALDALVDDPALPEGNVIPCVADIGDESSVSAIRGALSTAGATRVDLALMAAGLPVGGSLDVIPTADLALAAGFKTVATLHLLKAVEDLLAAGSRFVAIAGSLGLEPGPGDAAPGTSNAALINLMRQLSLRTGADGATVHTLAPGPVDTPRLRAFAARESAETGVPRSEIWQRYIDKTSTGRLPSLDEIAWFVTTLLAPEAGVLHGAVISLDGGVRRNLF
ncbi:short-chain dehydrogenase [Dietzia sp. JS16-p6b]|nr:short-chain dehydrogenase [Dietzia sp. JS16-p6b]